MNKTTRPFGLQFLELPLNTLAQVAGGVSKKKSEDDKPMIHPPAPDAGEPTIMTEALSLPSTACGRPDQF